MGGSGANGLHPISEVKICLQNTPLVFHYFGLAQRIERFVYRVREPS